METNDSLLISWPQVIIAFPRARELWGLHWSLLTHLSHPFNHHVLPQYLLIDFTVSHTHILFYYLLNVDVNLSSDVEIYLVLDLFLSCFSCFPDFLLFLTISCYLSYVTFPSLCHLPHDSISLSLWPFCTRSLQAFLTQLVCNLLDEGNSCFRDGDWRQATQQYGEGISVARYAQAEALVIPYELLESLYVNRAAAYYQTVREKCHMQIEKNVYQFHLSYINYW